MGDLGPAPRTPIVELAPITPAKPHSVGQKLSREVFGYLPYWELNAATERYLRYDLLTTIAFFGVPINPNGSIGRTSPGYQAYTGPIATRIIEKAHASGVRTEISFTSFGLDRNAMFFRNSPARRRFVKRAVALMRARGADGANIDVELLSSRYYRAFGFLVRDLKLAAAAANPNAQISVAVNANVSGARMAKIALENGADRIFVMGYDYRWSGSSQTGSIDPLVNATGGLSLTSTLSLFRHYRVSLDTVLLGLGYYGRSWPTASSRLRAPVRMEPKYGGSQVFFPRSLPSAKLGARFTYDKVEQSARLLKYDKSRKTWVQIYYNDPRTLAAKLKLTNERDLAGMGIWALGYDRGQPGYWEAIKGAYAVPHPIHSIVVRSAADPSGALTAPNATTTPSVFVTPTLSSTARGSYDVSFSNDGATWSTWTSVRAGIPWTLQPGADGPRKLQVLVRGPDGSVTGPLELPVALDTTPPTVRPAAATIPRRLRAGMANVPVQVGWGATDASAITTYSVDMSGDGKTWSPVRLSSHAGTNTTLLLAPGTYRFRVSARDAAGNVSQTVEGTPFSVGLTQDSSKTVAYSRGWKHVRGTSVSGGAVSSSKMRGATAKLTFTGGAIAVLGTIAPARGRATVTIDGVVNSFKSSASRRTSRLVLFAKALKPGNHTLLVRVDGTPGRPAVDLDAFAVLTPTPRLPVGPHGPQGPRLEAI